MLYYVLFLCMPFAVRCESESKWNENRLKETVIGPYQNALTLLNRDVVDKLIRIDLINDDVGSFISARELYCKVQEVCNNLKEAAFANDELGSIISLRVNQLSKSVSNLENEKTEIRSNLKMYHETIQDTMNAAQDYEEHHKVLQDPSLKERLPNYQNQLANESTIYRRILVQYRRNDLILERMTHNLEEQRAWQNMISAYDTQFKVIELHLKIVSNPSITLLDALKTLLNFHIVIEPLNSIYDEFPNELLTESSVSKISFNKTLEFTDKLDEIPQLRHFQQEFEGQCTYKKPSFVVRNRQTNTNETEWIFPISHSRFQRDVSDDELMDLEHFQKVTDLSAITQQLMITEQYENTVVTAPATVFLLGKIMVFSSRVDFSLMDFSKNRKYETLRNPHSFRATLAQVANDGWRAFMDAHSAMNKIQMYSQQIPRHIQIARRLIAANTTYQLLARLLPKSLKHLGRIGDECVALATKTRDSFDKVQTLLQEVEEATYASEGGHQQQLMHTRTEHTLLGKHYTQLERDRKQLDEELTEAKDAVRNARAELSNALDQIPLGLEATFYDTMSAVNGLISDFGSLVSGKAKSNIVSTMSGVTSKKIVPYAVSQTRTTRRRFDESLKSIINTLKNHSHLTSNQVLSFKLPFDLYSNVLNKASDNEIKDEAISLIERGLDAVGQMNNSVEVGEKISTSIKQQLAALVNDVKRFQSKPYSTVIDDPIQQTTSSQNTASAISNPKFKVEVRQKELRVFELAYNTRRSEMQKVMNDMSDSFLRMAKLDITEIHYKEILTVLNQTLHLLSTIKENWSDLVDFFRNIATGIETTINFVLTPFLENAGEVTSAVTAANDRKYLLTAIDSQGQVVQELAHLIFIHSHTYVDVSKKFLMKKLAGLSRLMLIKDETQRLAKLDQLDNEQKEVEKQVRAFINARRRAVEGQISKRRSQLEALERKFSNKDKDDDETNDLFDISS